MIYIIDEFILFLINPFGTFTVIVLLLFVERIIINSIKSDMLHNGARRVRIRQIY